MEEYVNDYWVIPSEKDVNYDVIQRNRAATILQDTENIETRQFAWHELNLWYSTLLTGRSLPGFRWGAEGVDDGELTPVDLRTENLVENVGQTFLAKAASSPLRPTLVPHGASWKTAKNVKLADKFLFGVWRQTHAEDMALQLFNDTYATGLGCLQVCFEKGDKAVSVESVFTDNVIIDNRECAGRAQPRTYRIRKPVHRSVLEEMYQKKLAKPKREYMPRRARGKDWEIVVEIWRLPDADGKNGYHGVVACGEILAEEEWTESWVPLVFMHWTPRYSGFMTKGGIEQVVPYQVRHNELNDTIEKAQRIACRPALVAPASTQFDWSQWDTDNIGGILLYHGMEPRDLKMSSNLTELYGERERNKAACYSHMGLSEMFAMGDLPQQVRMDSSAGMREARNMEDARHLWLWRNYERARLDLARTIMRVLGRADDSAFVSIYKPYAATTSGRKIAWEAIRDLNDDCYTWEMAAASLAQQTPAARRETLRDWRSRGENQASGGEMISNPDLERLEDLEIAAEEDIERHIEILENEEYEAPDVLTDTSKGLMMVKANYHRLLRYEDLDQSHPIIKNHRRWLVDAAARIASAMPAPQPVPQLAPFQPTQGMPGTSAGINA